MNAPRKAGLGCPGHRSKANVTHDGIPTAPPGEDEALTPLHADALLPVLYVDASAGLEQLHDEIITRLLCVRDLCNGINWSANRDLRALDIADLVAQAVRDALGLIHVHHAAALALESGKGGAA